MNITQLLDEVDLKNPESIQLAAKKLLESAIKFNVGDKVTLIDERGAHGCPYVGAVGTIKGQSNKGSGWYNVEFADGSVHPIQADLLVPIK